MNSPPEDLGWSGDMLDRPEMVAEWTRQLRLVLADQAAYVARIRRDAEAMWKANPPAEFNSFEAWWRHLRTTSPFGKIQEHLEEAARLTFALEARYRRTHHEIPAARQAAALAKQQAQALPRGAAPARTPAPPTRQATSAERRAALTSPEPPPADFMDLLRKGTG